MGDPRGWVTAGGSVTSKRCWALRPLWPEVADLSDDYSNVVVRAVKHGCERHQCLMNNVSVNGDGVPASAEAQRALVRRGYDAISVVYRDDDGLSGHDDLNHRGQYLGWIDELASRLPLAARVLDLGCRCGVPATRALADHGFDVVGLDFSATQIARARQLVPAATFVHDDMATWDAEPSSFDAVTSFYALIHVPLADQRRLLARMAAWLRPGGWALLIVGSGRWRGVEDFLGAAMFWDHDDRDTYLHWLRESGLEVTWHRFIPEGDGGHVLVLARKPEA